MDCSEVKELLSAFHDGELTSRERSAVGEHLEGCGECSGDFVRFERLSAMAADLDTPMQPAGLWAQIEQQLDREQVADDSSTLQSVEFAPRWSLPTTRLLALAASLLVIVGAWWFGYATWSRHGAHDELTADFGQYLAEFHRDPAAAQHLLLAKYPGQTVDVQNAVQHVGYRPAVANGLPEDYAVESAYVMKMPGCTCVQCLCKRRDGGMIAILEHDKATKQWFGNRPGVSTMCNGKQCRLVELDDGIAVSWQLGNRHIAVIGARDLAEVNQLVAWFDERNRSESLQ